MSGKTVLVVEDEPAIAETIEYALETDGFSVIVAGTGRAGLEALERESPDFLVLDVGLPDQSGFEVCREIRKRSSVPVLFLTARESEIDRVVGLELGGDDYVVKPFSPRELTARVHAILRRSTRPGGPSEEAHAAEDRGETAGNPGEAEWLRRGRVELSRDRREARFAGRDLELSRYEFGLLEVFLRSPERVFTRDQLMERVWDEPEAAFDRTVDAHIKTLRRKFHTIEPDFDPIRTHRGVGYSFVTDGH